MPSKVLLETLLENSNDSLPSNTSSASAFFPPVAPKPPSKCPLFCCFYSEFDIKKGPVVSFQTPKGFMDQDIDISTEKIQDLLARTFQELSSSHKEDVVAAPVNDDSIPLAKDDGARTSTSSSSINEPASSLSSASASGNPTVDPFSALTDPSIFADVDAPAAVPAAPSHPSAPAAAPASAVASGLSIFDSTSEYIITGAELTSKIITLSTHSWHVMTRPTMITNARYERNAHLFSVGFVLRRAADPAPFRPLLSKLAVTLQAMEEESRFLTSEKQRPKLQTLLERVLLSLNSSEWECNLLLSRSNALHLKLYHPPKPETSPVHDHQVPILLRRDIQLQMYDWDLAINWVILHIDGVTNARQISLKAEVDLEMVRACLRVLKHHGVIALVSPFNYSNRYEFTPRATAMLAGKEPKLLLEALEFCWKRGTTSLATPLLVGQHPAATAAVPNNIAPGSPNPHASYAGGTVSGTSMLLNNSSVGMASAGSDASTHPTHLPVMGSPHSSSYFGFTPSSSYPPRGNILMGGGVVGSMNAAASQRSSNFRFAMMAAAATNSLEKESSAALGNKTTTATNSTANANLRLFKSGIAELYCACSRNLSFGDLWLALTQDVPPPSGVAVPNLQSQQPPSATLGRHGATRHNTPNYSNRKGTISEAFTDDGGHTGMSVVDSLALSPLESFHLERLRRTGNVTASSDNNIKSGKDTPSLLMDWNDFFRQIDHRRFVTFGLIHGLITRIHAYPCFPYAFPDPPPSLSNAAAVHQTQPMTESTPEVHFHNSGGNSTSVHHNTGASNSNGNGSSNQKTQKGYSLAQSVASRMDGTRCDDELACIMELPFRQLVDVVEKYGKRKVICLYAERPDI